MATVPTPHSFTAGEFATATNLDSYYSALNFLLGAAAGPHPYCFAYQSASGQVLTGGAQANVTLDGEVEDSDSMHTTTGSTYQFTINTPGLYHVIAQVEFGGTTVGGTNVDHTIIQHTSSGITVDSARGTSPAVNALHRVQATVYIRCVATDTISLAALSTIGNTLTTGSGQTFMQARWVRQ